MKTGFKKVLKPVKEVTVHYHLTSIKEFDKCSRKSILINMNKLDVKKFFDNMVKLVIDHLELFVRLLRQLH